VSGSGTDDPATAAMASFAYSPDDGEHAHCPHQDGEQAEPERRHEDALLRDYLADRGFQGPDYDLFEEEVARYGLSVVKGMVRSRRIVAEAARRGLRGAGELSRDASWCWPREHDVDDLAVDTVRRALRVFRRKALVGGEWSPTGGASLKTYFVGTCVQVFLDVYRSWMGEQVRNGRVELTDRDLCGLGDGLDVDPAQVLSDRETLGEILDGAGDAAAREIVVLRLLGYSEAEVAEIVGKSVRAVEGVLYRFRRRIARSRSGGETR
jgi:DNA-directed RNA polymerase specialized sigma24 family protein